MLSNKIKIKFLVELSLVVFILLFVCWKNKRATYLHPNFMNTSIINKEKNIKTNETQNFKYRVRDTKALTVLLYKLFEIEFFFSSRYCTT